jgi:membrane peptidoglycan carboxypeptidase
MRPDSMVVDQPVTIGNWSPRNYSGGYRGRMTLVTALMKSINTVAVQLGQRVGIRRVIEAAHQAGLQAELRANPSMPLGTNEVTLLDLTGAYATFANGGVSSTPYAVLEISRPNGEVLYSRRRNGPRARQMVAPELISDLNFMLNQVILNGTGRRAQLGFTPQAGKTGTTSAYRDAWFLGYTAHMVTGVWFGNDDQTPTRRMTGGSVPAMTWQRFMAKALETAVAAPLLGVPLEGQYASYVDPDLSQVEVQFEDLPEGAHLVYDDDGNLISIETLPDDASGSAGGSDTVSRAFQNMFSVFRNSRTTRTRDNGTSRYTSQQPSGRHGNSNRGARNNRGPAIESLR